MNNRKDENYVTYYNLGQVYADSNDFEKALHFFNRAVNIFPNFPAAYNDIGALLNRKGKHEIGYKYLVKAFKINPNTPEVNFNLGLHYLREVQPEKAICHLSKLLDDRQFEDRLFLYLGIAFKQKGHLGRALTYFKKAKKKNPRNIKLYLHLAEIFYRIGDHEKAEREVAKAIDLIPDKDTFQIILDDLQKKDRSSNLHPRTSIIIPLMSKACLSKSETLKKWGDLLEKEALQLKAESGSKQK